MTKKSDRSVALLQLHSLDDLRPAPYNPRTIAPAAAEGLRYSMGEFGDISGIVWNARTGNLVCGHQRVEQLRKLGGELDGDAVVVGETRFAVRVVDWPEEKEKAANVAANNPHVAGDFTDDLGPLLDEIRAADAELFAQLRLQALRDDLPAAIGELGADEAPEPPSNPVTRPGDTWALGDHRLVCGDATDAGVVAAALGGALADMVWTDPPYGVDYVGKTKDALTIQNDALGADGLLLLLDGAFRAVTANAIEGAAVYVAHPPGALSVTFGQAFIAAGWRLHETLVWVKDAMVLGHSDYHYRHEPILYGYTPGGGRRGRGGSGWYGDNSQTTVLEYPRPKRSEAHPTMKPVALIADGVHNSCPPGGIVLDPFGGSGSTLIAADGLGRRAALVELDPRFCDVIVERWEGMTGGKAARTPGAA